MEATDFERSRISWTLKADDINGSWRIIATACRQDSSDCIYLAPAVMAGKIFGTDRLPLEPPFSFQLVATRHRHAMIREGEASGRRDSEADHGVTFSSFEIHAPRHATKHLEIGTLDSGAVTQQWPLSVRLKARGQRGELWNLEFPLSHVSTRAAEFQIETGPVLIPRELIEIPDASIVAGCYLAYIFLNKASQVDLLAFGPGGNQRRSFVHFARIGGIETEIFGRRLQGDSG